jgi:TonB family protein
MTESATQPQSETPSDPQPADTQPVDTQPVIADVRPPPEPPARWRVSRSVLLLIGVPIAGALLVWLAISTFGSNSAAPPEAVSAQAVPEPAAETVPAAETAPAPEPIPGTFPDDEPASVTETAPVAAAAPATEAIAQTPAEAAPAPAALAPPEQPDASLSAINEVLPKAPQSALDTIRGTVRVSVRVTVNKEGTVVDATPADGGPSRYFERISVAASRNWTFAPQASEEQRTMLLKFNFTRDGVTAQANADG